MACRRAGGSGLAAALARRATARPTSAGAARATTENGCRVYLSSTSSPVPDRLPPSVDEQPGSALPAALACCASSLLTGTSGCHTVAHYAMDCLIRKSCTDVRRARLSGVKGAEIIAEYLIRERVPYAVGLCGHGDLGLLDALYEPARADQHAVGAPRVGRRLHRRRLLPDPAPAAGHVHVGRPRVGQPARSRSARRSWTPRPSWRSPATCRPRSSTGRRSRRPGGTTRRTPRACCGPTSSAASRRPGPTSSR